MKKMILLISVLALALVATGCSMNGNNPDANQGGTNSTVTSQNDNTTNGHVNSGNAQDGTINQGNSSGGVVSEIVSDTMSMTESVVSKVK